MPTRPFTAQELEDAELAMLLAQLRRNWRRRHLGRLEFAHRASERVERVLLALAAETLSRSMRSRIGPERLSLARLQREAAEVGAGDGVQSRDIYARFGFRLEDLPRVIEALRAPAGFRLQGRHVISGEEALLIALRRYKTAGAWCPCTRARSVHTCTRATATPCHTQPPLQFGSTGSAISLCWETGRSESAISVAHHAVVQHIHHTFPHLIDSRSLSCFAPLFPRFAAAFVTAGIPLPNLVGFVDGKLWKVAFGKISNLWPWLDFVLVRAQQVLRRDVGAYLRVANVLTNMHTCLYGSIVSSKFGLTPPNLEAYVSGGPFS